MSSGAGMNGRPLTVGSLFSGIGGFDLGLERTGGFSTSWFCEQDEFCARVLDKHWPGVPVYPDISSLKGAHVEPVDVLCGGFPCQDLSIAGKGAGLAGARSGLWSEYARLIGELRPRYVLVENVAALLARGMGTVLGDLAALGYDAEWDCIPASAVGAPHRRDRVWLVAYPNGSGRFERRRPVAVSAQQPASQRAGQSADANGQVREERNSRPSEPQLAAPLGGGFRDDVADAQVVAVGAGLRPDESRGLGRGRPSDSGRASISWAVEPDVGRVAYGIPARVDRLRALGNALVPQIAEWIGARILEHETATREVSA